MSGSDLITVQQTEIGLLVSPTLSFAMEQSGVPLIRECRVRNAGTETLAKATLEFQLVPELGDRLPIALPELAPGEEINLGVIDYRLPPGRLRQVEETEMAGLAWQVQQEDQVIASGSEKVEVLAFNHWPGLRAPWGLLASFALPNHPAIGGLLPKVRDHIEGDNKALDGYQSRSPERVVAMLQALFQTVQAQGITYAEVPVSNGGGSFPADVAGPMPA